MRRIYKYTLDLQETTRLASCIVRPLSIQVQNDKICLWAEIDPDVKSQPIVLTIVGTGRTMSQSIGTYISTIQKDSYVWHFYWRYDI